MWNFFFFELKYRLKSLTPYLFLVLLAAIPVRSVIEGIKRYATWETVYPQNGSLAITGLLNSIQYYLVFMMAIFIYQMFHKAFNKRFHEILFTKPIHKYQYIFGSFLANLTVMFGIYVATMAIWRLMWCLPQVQPHWLIPDKILIHLASAFIIVLPNLIVCGFLCISAVLLTKRTSAIFVVCFVYVFINYVLGLLPFATFSNPPWEVFLDINGMWSVIDGYPITTGTREEIHTHVPGLTMYSIVNRVFWLWVSGGLLMFSLKRFDYDFSFKIRDRQRMLSVLNVFRKG